MTLEPKDAERRNDPVETAPGGRDEMNIAEFPITLLTDRSPRGQTRIEHRDTIYDPRSGREITRRLIITAPTEYGLPTSIDDDIILALIQLTKQQNNFTRPEVAFTRRQLIELLGWTDKGRNYDRIEASLHRWASTYLHYENAWWDNEERRWTSGGFHIIDSHVIRDGRAASGRGRQLRCGVTWGKEFFKSCQAGYLKSLDYDLYIRLNYHPAKRMYRFLDKRFYLKPEWTFELRDFAIEHVGLSRTYRDAGKIKEKLQPGIEELERIGFLEPLRREERYQKDGRDWLIRLVKRQPEPAPETSAAASPPADAAAAETRALEQELTRRGVTPATAAELVRQHPAAAIAAKLDLFDWLAARQDGRIRRNPAGFLVDSIRKDYAPPPGFEPRAERERREQQRREAEQQARAAQARRAAARAREHTEHQAVLAFWDALDPAERAALDAAALAEADDAPPAETLRNPALARLVRANLRHAYIRKRLRDQAAGPDTPEPPEGGPATSAGAAEG
ncbi:MAG: replication initiator protein A [Isosphaeraceae bacterium]|nr:replication initiator protein A [Isosphaeraceae bacterium]